MVGCTNVGFWDPKALAGLRLFLSRVSVAADLFSLVSMDELVLAMRTRLAILTSPPMETD